jgi:hypothetical protein
VDVDGSGAAARGGGSQRNGVACPAVGDEQLTARAVVVGASAAGCRMELVWLSLHWLKDGLEAPGAMVLAERAAGADGGGKFVVGAGSEPG